MTNEKELEKVDKNEIDMLDVQIEEAEKEDGEYYRSKLIDLGDGHKVEFIAEASDDELTKNEIFRDLQKVEERLCGTEDLTAHLDKFDYAISISSGMLCGLIDSFFVGEFDFKNLKSRDTITLEPIVRKYAEIRGYKGSGDYASVIRFLEEKFPVAQDNIWSGKGISSTKYHHLDDIAHHPSILGLLAAVLVQFVRVGIFVSKECEWHFVSIPTNAGELLKTWLPVIISGLLKWIANVAETHYKEESNSDIPEPINTVIKMVSHVPALIAVLKVADNWVGHLFSDVDGSNSTAGGGMGVPGLYLSFLKEVASVLKADELSQLVNDLYSKQEFDLRKELRNIDIIGKQMVPVVLGEVLVRGFFLVRHLAEEYKKSNDWKGVNWKAIVPFRNRTIVRMLTISKGTFTACDAADVAIRSSIKKEPSFILRINFVGVVLLVINVVVDVTMGVKRQWKIKKYDNQINIRLIRMYEKNAKGLSDLFKEVPESNLVTGPLFLHFDEKRYRDSRYKVMFVGTNNRLLLTYMGTRQTPDGLLPMFEEYKNYEGDDSFFTFARKVQSGVNQSKDDFILWNSMFKFGNVGGKSDAKKIAANENVNFNVLSKEIEICKLDAVIFMTGKEFDKEISQKFQNVSFDEICVDSENKKLPNINWKQFAEIKCSDKKMPKLYRIPNPNSLLFKLRFCRRTHIYNWLLKLIAGIEPEEKHFPKIMLIIFAILALLLSSFLLLPRYCDLQRSDITQQSIEITQIPVPLPSIPETKSSLFNADRSDFVNKEQGEQWLDDVFTKVNNILSENPDACFEIIGYVADFPNEIDDMLLSQERAERIADGLIRRGIPEEKITIIPGGKTNRWGMELLNNRAAVILSVVQ